MHKDEFSSITPAVKVWRSDDGGREWSGPHLVSETFSYANANWDLGMKGLGGGTVAADESGGPFDGTLDMTSPTLMGERSQIVTAHLRNRSRTWSDPVRVNDAGHGSKHSTPAVGVNAEGVVAVSCYDRRSDPTDACLQPYIAISTGGGRTFGPNVPVSNQFTCPGAGSRWLNGGDTQGLVALPGGSLRMAWIGGSLGNLTMLMSVAGW